jgi:hypothetical protein
MSEVRNETIYPAPSAHNCWITPCPSLADNSNNIIPTDISPFPLFKYQDPILDTLVPADSRYAGLFRRQAPAICTLLHPVPVGSKETEMCGCEGRTREQGCARVQGG